MSLFVLRFGLVCLLCAIGLYSESFASSGGQIGAVAGCTCHSNSSSSSVALTFSSEPAGFRVRPGDTLTITALASHATGQEAAGFNASIRTQESGGQRAGVFVASAASGVRVVGGEVTHSEPKALADGRASFVFRWIAPTAQGTYFLRGIANMVNLSGSTSGDEWNVAGPISIVVDAAASTDEETSVQAFQAFPNPAVNATHFVVPSGMTGATIRIYNVSGNLVRTLSGGFAGQVVPWEGSDDSGAPVETGRYFAVLQGGTEVRRTMVTITR